MIVSGAGEGKPSPVLENQSFEKMLFIVSFLACSLQCETVTLRVAAPTHAACTRIAMMAAAQWVSQHGDFEIRSIRCSNAEET